MATLKDVAKLSGLNVSTVSRILNGRGYISEIAKEKVESAMNELNYRPNAIARNLAKSRSDLIALVVPHINHPYFSMLIENIERECYKNGFSLLVFNTKDDPKIEQKVLSTCMAQRVSAMILCSASFNLQSSLNTDIHTFTIERKIIGIPSIEVDNYAGGLMAAEHLISKGCKNLVFLGGNTSEDMPADKRGIGFVNYATEHGVKGSMHVCLSEDYLSLDYRNTIRKLLLENKDCDGLFTSGDIIASQAIEVCHEMGIKVPDDIKIIGFDNQDICKITYPKLTTFAQPVKLIAKKALEFVNSYNEKKEVPDSVIFPIELIERGSTKGV